VARKLSPENQLELASLARTLHTIAQYFDARMSIPGVSVVDVVQRAHAERNLRGLRMLLPDMIAMTEDLSYEERGELDALLHARTGAGLRKLDRRNRERLERIVKRGRLTGEEQYYFVREQADLVANRSDEGALSKEIWRLLDEYEVRIGSPGKQ
jgi:hypothetical protein